LAVAAACPRLAQKGQQPWENQQLSILYNCKVDYEQGLARSFTFKKYRFSNMPHRPGTGISVIASIDNTKWITGGTDRKIVLWDVGSSKPFNQCATEDLHNLHTSAILSMFYDNRSQTIYSGGQDCRILGWSLSEQRNLLSDERKGGAVRDIIPISTHPSLLLLGIIDKAHSLQVFDTRTQKSELCIETNNSGASADENSNSRYVKASIHENGYLVSMGIQNSVCIWDLRYVKPQTPCASLGNIHSNTF
jgi:WD40 repeat protein